jgi:hypothetical protein
MLKKKNEEVPRDGFVKTLSPLEFTAFHRL